jgi:hypothetical protein
MECPCDPILPKIDLQSGFLLKRNGRDSWDNKIEPPAFDLEYSFFHTCVSFIESIQGASTNRQRRDPRKRSVPVFSHEPGTLWLLLPMGMKCK